MNERAFIHGFLRIIDRLAFPSGLGRYGALRLLAQRDPLAAPLRSPLRVWVVLRNRWVKHIIQFWHGIGGIP